MKWIRIEVGTGAQTVTHLLNLDSVGRFEGRILAGRGVLYAFLEDIAGKDYSNVIDVTPPSRAVALLEKLVLFLAASESGVFDVKAELATIP